MFLDFWFYFFSFMKSTYVQLLNQAREKCPIDIEASKQFEIYMAMLGSSVSNLSEKKFFLKISQYLLENTCVGVSFK